MRANALRLWLILALAAAAVVSAVGNRANSRFVNWLGLALFLCALVLYVSWRRTALAERRGRVFDREAKTDHETRTRSDQ